MVYSQVFWRMNNPITDQPESDLSDGQGNVINIATLFPEVNHHLYLKQLINTY